MKKLCVLIAIVCAAVALCASCGKPQSPAIKLTLSFEDNELTLPGPGAVLTTYKAETMQKAVEHFATEAPDIYNSDEMHKLVEQYGDFYVPDNGDEILEYTVAARADNLAALVLIQHGEIKLNLLKIMINDEPDMVELSVGDKTVYYSTNKVDGEDVITNLYYKFENGDVLNIFKDNRTHTGESYRFTIDEISALGEDFFNFKPEALKDYFGEDYIAGQTE